MINFICAILFSLAANLDNIAIGISYGLKKIHIPSYTILLISIFTTLFTAVSMLFGICLNNLNYTLANSIGAYILIFLGIYTLIKDFIFKKKHEKNDITNPKNINIKDLTAIIILLSTNNIAAGIAASATGINVVTTSFFSFIFSYFFILIGNNIGKNVLNIYVQKYSNLLSSLLLILLGILQF